ncbi:MAG: glycosyltransferase [Calditrichia bacterium]
MAEKVLDNYINIVGSDVVEHLRQLARPLKGLKVVHVNSTKSGGGVAEILHKMVPLMEDLDLEAHWEVIEGEAAFYQCTKGFHNAMQGNRISVHDNLLKVYEETNARAAEILHDKLQDADIVIIHDPQPAALINHFPDRKGKWVWRCHIDVSHPFRPVWKYLKQFISGYDASIFSLSTFAQQLPHPVYLIAPSIDPLHEKNIHLDWEEIKEVYDRFDINPDCPLLLQVSRFDRFKDPLGVIEAYQLARTFHPDLQLVLAGGGASDDPEGEAVLNEVRAAAANDPDIHVLLLPGTAHRTINALQSASDIILQKSLREGFGLTVTEALWKQKPVIGGDTGGIRMQVINHHTGFLVNTPEGAALRIRYLLQNRDKLQEMGQKAREFVLENFLITRHLREYLTLIYARLHENLERIEVS